MEALNILQVEDNAIDVLITEEILEQGRIVNSLHSLSSAEDALLYLNKRFPFKTASKPDLILLDINLPGSNGFAVLIEVKNNPRLRDIPVVILSSSTCPGDKSYALRNGADDFLEKPLEIELLKAFLSNRKEKDLFSTVQLQSSNF